MLTAIPGASQQVYKVLISPFYSRGGSERPTHSSRSQLRNDIQDAILVALSPEPFHFHKGHGQALSCRKRTQATSDS